MMGRPAATHAACKAVLSETLAETRFWSTMSLRQHP
jgi:hypothetical protein